MQVIFTSGYNFDDDEITKIKGHRSDVLVLDDEGNYYEINFVDIHRARSDLDYNINIGRKYFADICLVILEEVTKEDILNCLKDLKKINYFKKFVPLSNVEKNEQWKVFQLD